MIKKSPLYIILILFFIGCEPEETPIIIDGIGEINYTQIDVGEDYCYQKYYSLEDNLIVGENFHTDWDLVFSHLDDAIRLNSSTYMRAFAFDPADSLILDELIDNANWQYDNPTGNIALLALNNGQAALSKNYFFIDRGYDCKDNELDDVIFRLIDYDENKYTIQVINLSDDNIWTYNDVVEIEKTNNIQNTYFSLMNNDIVSVINSNWDLCFSQYVDFNVFLPGGGTPQPTYRVFGILQNSHISVAIDTINEFSEISIEDVINNYEFQFNFNMNTIGYDWKSYDLQTNFYSIDSPVYIIKTSDSHYYKLLFLDFYNNKGQQGAPMFQIEQI